MAFGWPGKGGWGCGKGFGKGNCATKFGPVAKVCRSAVPTTKVVPLAVKSIVPTASLIPIPRPIGPRTSFGKPIPVGATKLPSWGYGKGGFDKGFGGGFGKGKGFGGKGFDKGFGKGAGFDGGFGKGGPTLGGELG